MTLYKVGGSLENHDPTYVMRSSDQHLYHALKAGQFCYVFNSRQMGKSSLMVRTKYQLEAEGYACTVIDMTLIGSQDTTPLQWYKGIVVDLLRGFGCFDKLNLKIWWQEQEGISLLQKLSEFLEILLVQQFPEQNLCIFIDEIDSILSLNFPTDDFFALIRACYNQRAINPAYKRLTFALFGVATPSDLIADKNRTPFNIGTAINLSGFTLTEAAPLVQGLTGIFEQPEAMLREILAWTNGQPFLTQKLLRLLVLNRQLKNDLIAQNSPILWIKKIVRSQIIEKWESQDEPEHLRTIRDRLLHNSQHTGRLLGIYQSILQEIKIEIDDSPEQVELLLSGLVLKDQGFLKVKNLIYKEVFNLVWVQQQLVKIRPYSQTFEAWITSNQKDESRLLRGQALKDAQIWFQGKSLSDLDYQFLAASVESDRKGVQLILEAERAKAIEAKLAEEKQRLLQEQKTAKLQRLFLGAMSIAFLIASGLGLFAFKQYREARVSEIKALTSSSESLLGANRQLDAMIVAIKAKRKLESLGNVDHQTTKNVETVLNQAVYGSYEFNRLNGHKGSVMAVAISPDLQLIATGGEDQTVRIWKPDGSILHILKHSGAVWRVVFNPDSNLIVSASLDGSVKLWRVDGRLLKTLEGHQKNVWHLSFCPSKNLLISASQDLTAKIWKLDGTLVKTITNDRPFFGIYCQDKQIVTIDEENIIKTWKFDGTLIQELTQFRSFIGYVAISSNGLIEISANNEGVIKLWHLNHNLLKPLTGHQNTVWDVATSRDGQLIASTSVDQTLKLWRSDGTLLQTLKDQGSPVFRSVVFSQDSQILVTGSLNQKLQLWDIRNPETSEIKLLKTLVGHKNPINALAISPDDQTIASGDHKSIKLWNFDGKLLHSFPAHNEIIWKLAFSNDGQFIASASADRTAKIWTREGQLVATLPHNSSVWGVAFSPQNDFVVTSSRDDTLKFWQLDGKLIRSISGEGKGFNRLAISPDGQTIATAGVDTNVKLWSATGDLLATLPGHQRMVFSVAFTADGNSLVSGSDDQTLIIWNLKNIRTLNQLNYACNWVRDYLRTNIEVEESDRSLCQ